METKVSPLASFTWRSLLSARDLLKKGLKKVVGSVYAVNIWEDPWVPRLPHFCIFSQGARNADGPQVVSDLMVDREWNVALLNQMFTSWDVEAIRSIPIAHNARDDTWLGTSRRMGCSLLGVRTSWNSTRQNKRMLPRQIRV